MQALNVIKLILSLLPLIIETVKTIEAALPSGGQGAAKLALVKEALQSAFKIAGDLGVTFEAAWPAIQSIVAAVVAMFNKSGDFQK